MIVISDGLIAAGETDGVPIGHARILYDDVFGRGGGTLVASSEDVGFEKENAANYLTYDFWRPTILPATLEVQLPVAVPINYMMIVAHTLGTDVVAAQPQYWDGAAWADLADATEPDDDGVLAFLFEEVMADRIRLSLTTAASPTVLPSVGVVMAGHALAMERGVKLDHPPLPLQGKTTFSSNDSESGQWLGRSIRRLGVEGPIGFSHLTADWVRDTFTPFIVAARSYPFGWLWGPVDYPADAVYCRCDEDIKPKEDGLPNTRSVEFKVVGFVGS